MSQSLAGIAELRYRPSTPTNYAPKIGLIGCGGITIQHLRAYRSAGFQIAALCDLDLSRARQRAQEFYPEAKVFQSFKDLLREPEIEVVDIATHPAERVAIVEEALRARKHVLSQKPFVLNLDEGARLVDLADTQQCQLAVNQNGRWAPHFAYARELVNGAHLGEIFGVHLSCHWDHTWVAGTPFEKIKHLILYDYAVHWFDIVRCFLPGKSAKRVFASTARVPGQALLPNLLAQVLIEFDEAQATLVFDAGLPSGELDQTILSGTSGCLHSMGPSIQEQQLQVRNSLGTWSPRLRGQWFPDGFHGTMGELLCAIEQNRPCSIAAADNLDSLALCFAAIHSADTGQPVKPGSIRELTL